MFFNNYTRKQHFYREVLNNFINKKNLRFKLKDNILNVININNNKQIDININNQLIIDNFLSQNEFIEYVINIIERNVV